MYERVKFTRSNFVKVGNSCETVYVFLCALFISEHVYTVFGFNPFRVTGLLITPLKTSENLSFSDIFRGLERDWLHEIG